MKACWCRLPKIIKIRPIPCLSKLQPAKLGAFFETVCKWQHDAAIALIQTLFYVCRKSDFMNASLKWRLYNSGVVPEIIGTLTRSQVTQEFLKMSGTVKGTLVADYMIYT